MGGGDGCLGKVLRRVRESCVVGTGLLLRACVRGGSSVQGSSVSAGFLSFWYDPISSVEWVVSCLVARWPHSRCSALVSFSLPHVACTLAKSHTHLFPPSLLSLFICSVFVIFQFDLDLPCLR